MNPSDLENLGTLLIKTVHAARNNANHAARLEKERLENEAKKEREAEVERMYKQLASHIQNLTAAISSAGLKGMRKATVKLESADFDNMGSAIHDTPSYNLFIYLTQLGLKWKKVVVERCDESGTCEMWYNDFFVEVQF